MATGGYPTQSAGLLQASLGFSEEIPRLFTLACWGATKVSGFDSRLGLRQHPSGAGCTRTGLPPVGAEIISRYDLPSSSAARGLA